MKFDIFSWNEVPANVESEIFKGRLQLQISAPAALYVTAQGYEVLAGVAQSFDLTFSDEVTWRVDGDVRVWVKGRAPSSQVFSGEVFTNIDRMPNQSGTIDEVQRKLRLFEIEQRQILAEMRQERDLLAEQRQAAAAAAPPPPPAADDGGLAQSFGDGEASPQ